MQILKCNKSLISFFTIGFLVFFLAVPISHYAQTFTEVTPSTVTKTSSESPPMGAWGDLNNDGYPELMIPNFFPGPSKIVYFNPDSVTSLVQFVNEVDNIFLPGDIDNDGVLEIFIGSYDAANRIIKLADDGNYQLVNAPLIGSDFENPSDAAWIDYDNDGFIDLFVLNANENDVLYRNNGLGGFDIAENLLPTSTNSQSQAWGDYDNDGFLDLYLCVSGASNRLIKNNGDGSFTEITTGEVVNASELISSQNASWGDYDNDGDLDLYVVNQGDELGGIVNSLFQNNGDGSFTQILDHPLVNEELATVFSSWSDYNNDGLLDMMVTNETITLFENTGETFQVVPGEPFNTEFGAGISWADFNNDGFLDFFTAGSVFWENRVYQNNGNNNNWLKIRLEGSVSNKYGIGAKVLAYAGGQIQLRELASGNSRRNKNDLVLHFGLGTNSVVDSVVVTWPSGTTTGIVDVTSNQLLTIQEPTQELPVPTNLKAFEIESGITTLTFESKLDGARFLIERSQDDNSNYQPVQLSEITEVVDEDLGAGVTYFYRVAHQLGALKGAYSDEVSITITGNANSFNGKFEEVLTGTVAEDSTTFRYAAWGDLNNDGWTDLVGLRSEHNSMVFLNNQGSFTKAPLSTSSSNGFRADRVLDFGDYNNDGYLDIMVGRALLGQENNINRLYANNGDGTFTPVSSPVLESEQDATEGVAWGDFDNDGWLDLVTGGSDIFLYRNLGNGEFEFLPDVFQVDYVNLRVRGLVWVDFDKDGDLDLFAATSNAPNLLFANDGNGSFIRITEGPIVQDMTRGPGSEGGTWGDYNNDGYLDLFVSNNGDETGGEADWLYQNNQDGTFTRIFTGPLVNESDFSWGASWVDMDNDGDLDIFVLRSIPTLFENNGRGRFIKLDQSPLTSNLGFTGIAWGDSDRDGFQDLFLSSANVEDRFFRNRGNTNNWLNVQLKGVSSNAIGLGSKISLYHDENLVYSDLGEQGTDVTNHFGLAQSELVDSLRIEWPSGIQQTFHNLDADQYLSISELGPTVGASDLVIDEILSKSMNVKWNMGNGTHSLVVAREEFPVNMNPEDEINYQSTSNFEEGVDLGDGNYVVYSGIDSSFVLSGLHPSTVYNLKVLEYNLVDQLPYFLQFDAPIAQATTAELVTDLPSLQKDVVKIYPNPSSGNFTISIPENMVVEKLLLYNSLGLLVEESSFPVKPRSVNLTVTELPPGIYYLNLITPQDRISKKLILVHHD